MRIKAFTFYSEHFSVKDSLKRPLGHWPWHSSPPYLPSGFRQDLANERQKQSVCELGPRENPMFISFLFQHCNCALGCPFIAAPLSWWHSSLLCPFKPTGGEHFLPLPGSGCPHPPLYFVSSLNPARISVKYTLLNFLLLDLFECAIHILIGSSPIQTMYLCITRVLKKCTKKCVHR